MSLKSEVRALLERYDRRAVVELALEDRRVVPALNRLLFDEDELIRWRAVEGFGWLAREDPFLLEKIIARLIYTMNDDSGSIGWGAPYALGEICACDPDLVEDFFPIVISSIDLEVFRHGVIWAIGRVAPVRPDLVADTGPVVAAYLPDRSVRVRGLACWTLARLNWPGAAEVLIRLLGDRGELTIYQDGQLWPRTVGRLAEEGLERIKTA
jgi:HEAT repeat protein